MNFENLSFLNANGIKIAARLDLPSKNPLMAYALFAHCFTSTENVSAIDHICSALTNEGIAVLSFNLTGLEESADDLTQLNESSNVTNLIAATDFLKVKFEAAPQILIGHSLGGPVVLQTASQIPQVHAIATIGAPYKPEAVAQLKKALLIFHSPLDNTVGIQNATDIFKAAKHPKSLISLDRADHLLSNPEDSLYVGSVLANWAKKYIQTAQTESAKKPLNLSNHHVVVYTNRAKYRTEIKTRHGHTMIADEPLKEGGTNLGPNPFTYLMSALGACMCITLRMYADRKDWPLEEVYVGLRLRRIDATDCDECQTKQGKVAFIECEFEFVGPLDDNQRSRLLQIAGMCPIHRTLTSEIIVKKQLKA